MSTEQIRNWTCELTESRLTDYLDGALLLAERAAFDAHVASCVRCAPLVSSVSQLVSSLHAAEKLETPPRLVYNILDKTLGPRETVTGWRGVLARLRGFASPRLAYGAVSVAATLFALLSASGFSWHKPKLADLRPANIYRNADRQVHLVYARSTKFVSDLRVVYEIQSRLNDERAPSPEETLPYPSPNKEPGRTDSTRPGSPKQQNRADGLDRNLRLLAAATALRLHIASVALQSRLTAPSLLSGWERNDP